MRSVYTMKYFNVHAVKRACLCTSKHLLSTRVSKVLSLLNRGEFLTRVNSGVPYVTDALSAALITCVFGVTVMHTHNCVIDMWSGQGVAL